MATFRQRGRENTAKVLLNDFNASKDHSYFLAIGNAVTSPVATTSPTPDTIQADYTTFDNMFFMNQILRSDVSLMIKNIPWQANQVYVAFDKDKNQYESGDLFYAYNSDNRSVYLCLASPSNTSATSTYPPSSLSTEPEIKLDGYTWKFLYQVSEEDLEKFDYPNFIPIQEIGTDLYTDQRLYQQNVASAAIRGAIEAIDVSVQGNAYAGAVNVNFTNSLYFIASQNTDTAEFPIITIDPSGRLELALADGFYDNKYVIYFKNKYTATIQTSVIDSTTGYLQLTLCNPSSAASPPQGVEFSILPRIEIIGNGSSAIAIPVMTEDKLISKITMIDGGSNYSYVDVSVLVENGTVIKPVIGLNGLASDVIEVLGARHLMISKKIKPLSSLSESDPVVYSAPENTGIVYDGAEYLNIISPNTYYTQISLVKSPKKFINGLEEIAGTTVIEVKEMIIEAIDPTVTITIGTTTTPYTNNGNFFEINDVITRGPNNYPDQFRAIITNVTSTGFSTALTCSLVNGAFETYSGYRIKNLKNTTETGDDEEFIFQDCDNNCSNSIEVVYENTYNSSDFILDSSLNGGTSFATAQIVPPPTGYGFVHPHYPTKATIKVKNVTSGFLTARYEDGEYIPGEVVTAFRVTGSVASVGKRGTLVSVSETIQTIGDDSTVGYSYILECAIDRGAGQINTPEQLVADGISLDTNILIRQGTQGTVGKLIRTAIPGGTSNTDIVYLYVNNYNGVFTVSGDNLYIINDLYNPTTYTNMKLTVQSIIYQPTVVRYSGNLLYINDAGPIQRRIENTENLKLLIES
jgi:hypothetical protein